MHPTMPAIVLTGHGTLENYQKAAHLGMTAYVQKPFNAREMMRIVDCALGDSAVAGLPADGLDGHAQRITGSPAYQVRRTYPLQ
jgi:DNA-binding NtrC family response regulator